MDYSSNKKRDKQSIYEMFRACRLCGAGGGYKMPIIQNIVDLGDNELKLKEKIKECVNIDVQPDDKMPPLICELCIDKINELYDFIQLCQLTNTKTRTVLGLPLKTSLNNSDDCILGRLSPICHEESDNEVLVETKVKVKKAKGGTTLKPPKPIRKSEPPKPTRKCEQTKPEPPKTKTETPTSKTDSKAVNSKRKKSELEKLIEDLPITKSKSKVKARSPSPSPKRVTRTAKDDKEEPRIRVKDESKLKAKELVEEKIEKPKSRKIAASPNPERVVPKVEEVIEKPRAKKRPLETTVPSRATPPPPAKKAKVAPKPVTKPKRAPTPPPSKEYTCRICSVKFKSLGGHMKSHDVLHTEMRLSCRPCAEWFLTASEASSHHMSHKSPDKPYRCARCCGDFTLMNDYDEHVLDYCPPYFEEPDIRCDSCWNEYPTQLMYDEHNCLGEDGRPGGNCSKCKQHIPLLKDLQIHEPTCNKLTIGDITAAVDLAVIQSLRGVQIRVAKCDKLMKKPVGDRFDVSGVRPGQDLDKKKVYPYNALHQGLKLRTEPNAMVKIPSLYLEGNNLHWDSAASDTDIDESGSTVKTLTNLCLKVIYSHKLLGKMERKKRINSMYSHFDEIDEQKFMGTNDNLISNLHDDGGEKNDDVISKSSLEIDISHVRSLTEFCASVSDKKSEHCDDECKNDDDKSHLDNKDKVEQSSENKMDVDDKVDDETTNNDNHDDKSQNNADKDDDKSQNNTDKDDDKSQNNADKDDDKSQNNADKDDDKSQNNADKYENALQNNDARNDNSNDEEKSTEYVTKVTQNEQLTTNGHDKNETHDNDSTNNNGINEPNDNTEDNDSKNGVNNDVPTKTVSKVSDAGITTTEVDNV